MKFYFFKDFLKNIFIIFLPSKKFFRRGEGGIGSDRNILEYTTYEFFLKMRFWKIIVQSINFYLMCSMCTYLHISKIVSVTRPNFFQILKSGHTLVDFSVHFFVRNMGKIVLELKKWCFFLNRFSRFTV